MPWLFQLHYLQQLTHLEISGIEWKDGDPLTALSAPTASSHLQELEIACCKLPAGFWQHVFPAGRQLPHLQDLHIWHIKDLSGAYVVAPEGSRLVSCCPSLQLLHQHYTSELLSPLQRLSSLRTLVLGGGHPVDEGLEGVARLTQLRELGLDLMAGGSPAIQGQHIDVLLLQFTQLQQLTVLDFRGHLSTWSGRLHLTDKVGCNPICVPSVPGTAFAGAVIFLFGSY
jgi:hypothetical protein